MVVTHPSAETLRQGDPEFWPSWVIQQDVGMEGEKGDEERREKEGKERSCDTAQ